MFRATRQPPPPQDPSDQIARDLAQFGWSVCENFVTSTQLQALRAQLHNYVKQGDFRAARVGTGNNRQLRPEVRCDQVHWLEKAAPTVAEAAYFAAMEALRQALNQTLYLGLFEFEAHMTLYPPGSFYRKHLDQFQGATQRQVSTILYLNHAWQAQDGGQLRLYLQPSGEGDYVDILPRGGSLVCFLSERFYHEVLATQRSRMSITGWFKVRPSSL